MDNTAFDLNSLVVRATAQAPYEGEIAGAAKKIGQTAEQQFAETSEAGKKVRETFEADKSAVEEAKKGMGPVPDEKWTKQAPEPSPLQAFGSAASVFAIAAAAFTHTPITNALNGAAAAMNALHANDLKAYEDAYNTWKENTRLAMERHTAMHQEYQDAMEKMKTDLTAGNTMLQMIATKYGDKITETYHQAGLLGQLDQAWQSRNSAMLQIAQIIPTIEKGHDQRMMLMADPDYREVMDKIQKYQAGQGPPPSAEDGARLRSAIQKATQASASYGGGTMTPSKMKMQAIQEVMDEKHVPYAVASAQVEADEALAKSNAMGSGLTDDAKHLAAVSYLVTGNLPYLGMGAAGGGRQAIMNEAAKIAKEANLTPEEIIGARAEVKSDFASLASLTRVADSAISFENTALKNLDLAMQLYPKDSSPDMGPLINRWVMEGETMLGDPTIPKYAAALLTGANEYAKVTSGATGAQGSTDASRRETAEVLNRYLDKGQIGPLIDEALKPDMKNREKSLLTQRDEIKKRIQSAMATKETPDQADKFEVGKVYKDKNGNKARYKGNGQWEDVP